MDATAQPSLSDKLDKIRSPKLQNQRETGIVLTAIEDTLRDQSHGFTPTAYFAALLALLGQAIPSSQGIVNKELAASVVYLLDIVTPHVPVALLRSKFSQILTSLAPALTHQDAEAPLLRSSIGCLEFLVVAQDSAAWALPQTEIGPRRAVGGLLTIAADRRPKVRKAAQDALTKILKTPPPSPSLDHPAADLCAETALWSLNDIGQSASKKSKGRSHVHDEHSPALIHALQLVKTIANASGGWPSKKIESLCEVLLNISKSSNEYLTMTAFEVYEAIFAGMANEVSSSKLPRLLEVIVDLQPSQTDSQLLPPWIAVISRGYDVSAQMDPDETFQKLPQVFALVSSFLSSTSHNIRISASGCLVSFLTNCIPSNTILEPSVFDEKTLKKLCGVIVNLLSIKYQAAWTEVFNVLTASFDALKWRSTPLLEEAIRTVGDLRGSDSFNGKKEADAVLGAAVGAVGPEAILSILPLNLANPKAGVPGRAWLLPILRDHVVSTNLAHFRSEFVPLSQSLFQRVMNHGQAEKTIEIKIYETMVQQIWSILPGYCNLPLDLSNALDQPFAELLSNLLYQQTELRVDICKALQLLVDANKDLISLESSPFILARISKVDAKRNIEHLASFAENLLAVLFNVYSQTLPQFRGYILQCINAYLSIIGEKEIIETFNRVTNLLESSLPTESSKGSTPKSKQVDRPKDKTPAMPPTSHTLMDLTIALARYLPSSAYPTLLNLAAKVLPFSSDPQLQKKAYKLFPRLAQSPSGPAALTAGSTDLQTLLLSTTESATPPCKRDRLSAVAVIVSTLPKTSSLHFIPSVLSEVVIAAKEVNEKARIEAFDLLVLMARTMREGGIIDQSKIPHMGSTAPTTTASLEEFVTMVSAGLAGSSPHMVSASITALTRILYDFRSDLAETMLEDLVSTMELFLSESKNREIVRSVLGFVKVAVISLPDGVMPKSRVNAIVKGLMIWSKEHKNRFRSKVKHILERMGRRFGWDIIENACPEEDRKFVTNIRKMKERSRRKKKGGENADEADDEDGEQRVGREKRRGKFESEFDEAVYCSASASDSGSASDSSASGKRGKRKNTSGKRYIVEDEDEPLDLLDRRALGHISSTKPLRNGKAPQAGKQNKAKINVDGKLVLGNDDDGDDVRMQDAGDVGPVVDKDASLESGIGAYVEAIRGRDAAQRGRGGRLKFSNRRDRKGVVEEEDGGEGPVVGKNDGKQSDRNGSRGGRGTIGRGLGVEKRGESGGKGGVRTGRVGGGRVGKRFNTRGGGARGGRSRGR